MLHYIAAQFAHATVELLTQRKMLRNQISIQHGVNYPLRLIVQHIQPTIVYMAWSGAAILLQFGPCSF